MNQLPPPLPILACGPAAPAAPTCSRHLLPSITQDAKQPPVSEQAGLLAVVIIERVGRTPSTPIAATHTKDNGAWWRRGSFLDLHESRVHRTSINAHGGKFCFGGKTE